MLTHAQIWMALDRLAARSGLTSSGLAKKAGLDPTTFNKSKRTTPDGRLTIEAVPGVGKIDFSIERSVAALRADITSFIDRHNADPRPFRWTKSADDFLASIELFCRYNVPAKHDARLQTSGSGH